MGALRLRLRLRGALVVRLLALAALAAALAVAVAGADADVDVGGFPFGACGVRGGVCCPAAAATATATATARCHAGEGSCATAAGLRAGVCSDFGGAFVRVASSAVVRVGDDACTVPRFFFDGRCACAEPFSVEVCVAAAAAASSSSSSSSSSVRTPRRAKRTWDLCACAPKSGPYQDFGGMFATDSPSLSAAGTTCLSPNPLADGVCACANGTKVFGPFQFAAPAGPGFLRFCVGPQEGAFAGAYQEVAGKCVLPNVFGGRCACPAHACPVETLPGVFVCHGGGVQMKPGLAAFVRPRAIVASLQNYISVELSELAKFTLHIPDFSGHDYKAEDIVFKGVHFPNYTVSLSHENTVSVALWNGWMDGSMRLEVKKDFIKTHSSIHPFTLTGIVVDVSVEVALLVFGGRLVPEVSAVHVSASVAEVDVGVHGNALCHAVEGEIKKKIREAAQADFPGAVTADVDSAVATYAELIRQNLSSFPYAIALPVPLAGVQLEADVSLTGCALSLPAPGSPEAPFAVLPVKASWFASAGPFPEFEPAGFEPAAYLALDPNKTKDDSVGICMSPNMLTTATWQMWGQGVFDGNITNADIPPSVRPFVQLNTSNILIKQLAPGLAALFPDAGLVVQADGTFRAKNSTYVRFTVLADGLRLGATTTVVFWVLTPAKHDGLECIPQAHGFACRAFELGLTYSLEFLPTLTETPTAIDVSGSVRNLTLSWQFFASQTGKVDVSVMTTLDSILVPIALKEINALLKNTTVFLPKEYGGCVLSRLSDLLYSPSAKAPQVCVAAADFHCAPVMPNRKEKPARRRS